MAESGYVHVKWVRDEPGARAAVAEAVAHDLHTAWRMLDNNVKGWDLTKLRLVVLCGNLEGPNYFIRINPDLAPKAPMDLRHGNTDYDVEKQRSRYEQVIPVALKSMSQQREHNRHLGTQEPEPRNGPTVG